jgi:hypothetical protein
MISSRPLRPAPTPCCSHVAMGHYVRLEPRRPPQPARAAHRAKDQSYVLAPHMHPQLRRAASPWAALTSGGPRPPGSVTPQGGKARARSCALSRQRPRGIHRAPNRPPPGRAGRGQRGPALGTHADSPPPVGQRRSWASAPPSALRAGAAPRDQHPRRRPGERPSRRHRDRPLHWGGAAPSEAPFDASSAPSRHRPAPAGSRPPGWARGWTWRSPSGPSPRGSGPSSTTRRTGCLRRRKSAAFCDMILQDAGDVRGRAVTGGYWETFPIAGPRANPGDIG